MNTFFNAFLRTFGVFIAILLLILVIIGISSYESQKITEFNLIGGTQESKNTIVVLQINGPIIDSENDLSDLIGLDLISPSKIELKLNEIIEIKPKILIVSINTPGGTVSASNKLYELFSSFKKKTNTKIFFHTTEILASGGYWASLAGEKIYASYGSIIGSIGVKGPTWFYYDKPKLISSGAFGQTIEVENEIKVFSTISGKSKDLFNPFREPTKNELNHLNTLVDEINEDFIQLVSRIRKIEKNTIRNDIGGLIFNSNQAKKNFLIDEQLSFNELINLITKENNFKDVKILQNKKQRESLLNTFISNNIMQNDNYKKDYLKICNRIKTNISTILSYSSAGC